MEEEPSEPGSEPGESGSERRTSKRYTTRSLVEVRIPTWTALQAVYTVNLSLGGMRLSLGARIAMGAIEVISALALLIPYVNFYAALTLIGALVG